MEQLSPDAILPPLRPELQLLPGVREINGLKCWLIFDPVRHEYFQIDDKSRHIVEQWQSGSVGALLEHLAVLDISVGEIEELLRFLWSNSLTLLPPEESVEFYAEHQRKRKRNWFSSLLHAYLFFVIPLFRPDKILQKTQSLTGIFFTRGWWLLVGLVGVLGLYLTSRQWDQFMHTFSHFFNFQGLLHYAVALVFVKVAHECGHAYAAARYGCRVKSMGIAFIVMFPVLYTDTTDSWKLTSKKHRLVIGGAGVAVEIMLATIATLVWALATEGPLRTAAFFVATTSWVMSLLINMNPLMRFDAYYFLSDALGIQNLQSRTFAVGRWYLREMLFGLGEPLPEAMRRGLRNGLICYAWLTWVYRFFLFTGIALIVHQMFFRPVGTLLAILEVIFFIVIPIMNEIKEWQKRKTEIIRTPSTWATMSVVVCLLLMLFLPWQNTVRIPAILEPGESLDIYSPADARIEKIMVKQGDQVQKNQIIARLSSGITNTRVDIVQREIDLRIALLDRIASDEIDLQQRVVLQSELRSFREELAGLNKRLQRLNIRSSFTGVVASLSDQIHKGRWVGENQYLVTINSQEGVQIRGFVERSNLGRLDNGASAKFVPELLELDTLQGSLELVESANAENLNIAALASHYGGAIAVNNKDDLLKPLKAWYYVNFHASDANIMVTQQRRGTVLAKGARASIASRIWRRLFHVVIREVLI